MADGGIFPRRKMSLDVGSFFRGHINVKVCLYRFILSQVKLFLEVLEIPAKSWF